MAAIQLYQLLKPKLGDRETEALINFVDVKTKEVKQDIQESNLKALATKSELFEVKAELKEDIARLDVKISDFKSDIIRWVFAMFVALMLAIIGLYFKH